MRTRKKDQSNLIKVGVFISLLTAVLMIMVMSIGKENSIFTSKVNLKARVANVSNLKAGSYVELKGIRVGSVTEVEIVSQTEVEIYMTILEKELKWIRKDSKVSISSAGLVGDKFVEIYNGSDAADPFNPETDTLFADPSTDMKVFLRKGESIASVTERILQKLDMVLSNLDDGKKIVIAVNSVASASQNLEKITAELSQAHMGGMVKNVNSSMAKIDKASGSLERILARLETGPGSAHSIIYDDKLHDDLTGLLGGASRNKVIKYFIRESIKNSEKKKK